MAIITLFKNMTINITMTYICIYIYIIYTFTVYVCICRYIYICIYLHWWIGNISPPKFQKLGWFQGFPLRKKLPLGHVVWRHHQEFPIPQMEESWTLWPAILGAGFPVSISFTYSLQRWGFLHFRYLKCLVTIQFELCIYYFGMVFSAGLHSEKRKRTQKKTNIYIYIYAEIVQKILAHANGVQSVSNSQDKMYSI